MTCRVFWSPEADAAFIKVVAAHLRGLKAIGSAATALEHALQREPLVIGQARLGLVREAVEPPLAAIYEVIPDDLKVVVLDVWCLY